MNRPGLVTLVLAGASWRLSCSTRAQVTAAGALPRAGGFLFPCRPRHEATQPVGPAALREAVGLPLGGRS